MSGPIPIADGDTPDGSDLETISFQTVNVGTTSERNGWAAAPDGAVWYDTSRTSFYFYDGTDWYLSGMGRRIGFSGQANAVSIGDGSDIDFPFADAEDFPAITEDTDGFQTSDTTFTCPAWAPGRYTATFMAKAANVFGFGGAGGYVKINRNHGDEVFEVPVGVTVDGSDVHNPQTVQTVTATFLWTGSQTLNFQVYQSIGTSQDFNGTIHCYRDGA